jgi:molecular chaperone Hsp33
MKKPSDHDALRLQSSFEHDMDIVQPFHLEASNLRGRLVRLDRVVDTILSKHAYPEPVAQLLAETITLGVTLASLLKYDGVFTLQLNGDGVVPMLVCDVTSQGAVRGYAQFRAEALASLVPDSQNPQWLRKLVGKGYLAFTVDQGEHTDRYQGIVELDGQGVADWARHYFNQSEQLDTGLSVMAMCVDGHWRSGALIVQKLPDQQPIAALRPSDDEEDDWRRVMLMLQSLTRDELLSAALPANQLLYRLFNEDGVRVFQRHDIYQGCRCSEAKILGVLRSLPYEEMVDMAIEGNVEVTCEFCSTLYAIALDRLNTP